jgi:hypothetical protein
MARLRRIPYTKPIPSGAEVVTHKGKPHARFIDGGRTVVAPLTNKGDRIRLLSKKWYGEYRDADDLVQCVPLSTDKTAAGQMLAALVKKAELAKGGITDPFEAHRRRPRPNTWPTGNPPSGRAGRPTSTSPRRLPVPAASSRGAGSPSCTTCPRPALSSTLPTCASAAPCRPWTPRSSGTGKASWPSCCG